jgi:hypothetical protein
MSLGENIKRRTCEKGKTKGKELIKVLKGKSIKRGKN